MSKLLTSAVLAGILICGSSAQAGHGCCGYDIVYETRQIVCYQNVCETKWKDVEVTICKPVYEKSMVHLKYQVCKPVTEMVAKTVVSVVCKPVYEDREMEFTNVVRKPVVMTRQIQVDCGHFETVCTTDSCGRCCYHKVWHPKIETREIQCHSCTYERQVVRKPIRICKMVPEEVTKEIMVPVCRMTYETMERDVPITKCRLERHVETRRVSYTEVKCVPVTRTIQVPVCVPR